MCFVFVFLCKAGLDCLVIGEEGHSVDYKPGKNEVKRLTSPTASINIQHFAL